MMLTQPVSKEFAPAKGLSLKTLFGRVMGKAGEILLYLAAAVTPQPKVIEVRMSDGKVLRNISARTWERHSALIKAQYDHDKGR